MSLKPVARIGQQFVIAVIAASITFVLALIISSTIRAARARPSAMVVEPPHNLLPATRCRVTPGATGLPTEAEASCTAPSAWDRIAST